MWTGPFHPEMKWVLGGMGWDGMDTDLAGPGMDPLRNGMGWMDSSGVQWDGMDSDLAEPRIHPFRNGMDSKIHSIPNGMESIPFYSLGFNHKY